MKKIMHSLQILIIVSKGDKNRMNSVKTPPNPEYLPVLHKILSHSCLILEIHLLH